MSNGTKQAGNKKTDRKRDIIYGGLKVFCEKGYDGTTVDDIVKKAGCSHGLFYHYFSTKKEVFDEIIKLKSDRNFSDLQNSIEETASCCEKLRAVINSMFYGLVHDENYAYYFYFFVSNSFNLKEKNIKLPPPPKDKEGKFKRPVIDFFEKIFEEGQKNGEFTDKYTPKECAIIFNSIIQGATLGYVIAPKEIQQNISLPNTEFIIDIFRKETCNE